MQRSTPWQRKGSAFSVSYEICTELAKSTGPENIGSENAIPAPSTGEPVNSPAAITFEDNGKIRPRPDWETPFARASGGGDGTTVEPSLDRKPLFYMARRIYGTSIGVIFCRLMNG